MEIMAVGKGLVHTDVKMSQGLGRVLTASAKVGPFVHTCLDGLHLSLAPKAKLGEKNFSTTL